MYYLCAHVCTHTFITLIHPFMSGMRIILFIRDKVPSLCQDSEDLHSFPGSPRDPMWSGQVISCLCASASHLENRSSTWEETSRFTLIGAASWRCWVGGAGMCHYQKNNGSSDICNAMAICIFKIPGPLLEILINQWLILLSFPVSLE